MSKTKLPNPGDFSHQALLAICAAAIVPRKHWADHDTPSAQRQVGHAWALLSAGCVFHIAHPTLDGRMYETNEYTIWIEIYAPTFHTVEYQEPDKVHTFYLPTVQRLLAAKGGDWY